MLLTYLQYIQVCNMTAWTIWSPVTLTTQSQNSNVQLTTHMLILSIYSIMNIYIYNLYMAYWLMNNGFVTRHVRHRPGHQLNNPWNGPGHQVQLILESETVASLLWLRFKASWRPWPRPWRSRCTWRLLSCN